MEQWDPASMQIVSLVLSPLRAGNAIDGKQHIQKRKKNGGTEGGVCRATKYEVQQKLS